LGKVPWGFLNLQREREKVEFFWTFRESKEDRKNRSAHRCDRKVIIGQLNQNMGGLKETANQTRFASVGLQCCSAGWEKSSMYPLRAATQGKEEKRFTSTQKEKLANSTTRAGMIVSLSLSKKEKERTNKRLIERVGAQLTKVADRQGIFFTAQKSDAYGIRKKSLACGHTITQENGRINNATRKDNPENGRIKTKKERNSVLRGKGDCGAIAIHPVYSMGTKGTVLSRIKQCATLRH